jgi:hypothetical protein
LKAEKNAENQKQLLTAEFAESAEDRVYFVSVEKDGKQKCPLFPVILPRKLGFDRGVQTNGCPDQVRA